MIARRLYSLLTIPPATLHLNPTSIVLLRDIIIGRSLKVRADNPNFLTARWWSFLLPTLEALCLLHKECGLLVSAAAAHESYSTWSLKMCSHRPGDRVVNSACHTAYGELIRLWAENTLSTVDRGHREMISIMKAFNSSGMDGGGEEMWKNASREELHPAAWLVHWWMISSRPADYWLALEESQKFRDPAPPRCTLVSYYFHINFHQITAC